MIVTRHFEMRSTGKAEPLAVTSQIERLVRSSGLVNGSVQIFVPGTGCSLLSVECPGGNLQAVEDVIAELLKLTVHPATLSNLVPSAYSLPFVKGQLQRSTWQEILLVDFLSEERWHQIVVQLIGE